MGDEMEDEMEWEKKIEGSMLTSTSIRRPPKPAKPAAPWPRTP